jgi:hypothetical protein
MGIQSHIQELDQKHKRLEQAIDAELKRPTSDSIRLKTLKKQKLRIKEEIVQLSR